MSFKNFIPTIWSARLLAHLDKYLVFPQLINTDWEGEITAKGDKVNINQIGDPTIGDYDETIGMGDPEELSASQLQLEITETPFYNFRISDIDKIQGNIPLMDKAMSRAAYKLALRMDSFIAEKYIDAPVDNILTRDDIGHITGDTLAYDVVVDTAQVMDELNVPEVGRWMVIPPWFHSELLKSEVYKQAWQNYIMTRNIPEISGIKILKSNNLKTTGDVTHIMAGTDLAIAFAMQKEATPEAYRPEKFFADAMRGRQLYGAKTVEPKSLVVVNASKSTD